MKTSTTERSPLGSDHCSASFVAGPWEVKKARTVLRVMGESLICEISLNDAKVDWMDKAEWKAREEANARAIAAVPQMFAALERLEKACNAVHEVSGGTPQHEAMWLAQLEARDAITEVTGIPWQNSELSQPEPE